MTPFTEILADVNRTLKGMPKPVLDDAEKERRRKEAKIMFELHGRNRPGESKFKKNTPDFEWINGNREL